MRRKPVVIMMYGYPATGKTIIAKKLTNSLKNKYNTINIATLDFRKKFNLFNLKSDEQRNKVYDLLTEHVKNIIEKGNYEIIVIDGNFNKRHRRNKLYSILKDSIVYVINCVVSDERIIKERIKERQKNPHIHENKAATIELYNMIKDSGDNIKEDEIVKKGIISLIQFNSEKEIIEKIELSEINNDEDITNDILSILKT